MTLTKKLLSVMTAAAIAAASVPAVLSSSAFAATTTDVSYDYTDLVESKYFYYTGCTDEVKKELQKVFENATKKELSEITYGDLEKITSLNLSGLKLEGIPKAVEYMIRLRTLNLANNLLRDADAAAVDITSCINLTGIDLSGNYLTTIPSWYSSMDIATKKINNNLINTSGQRSIVASPSVYYFMDGDIVNENELKNKVLCSVKMSDGSALPKFFFDPENLPYDNDDPSNTGIITEDIPVLEIGTWDLSDYMTQNRDGTYTVKSAKAASTEVSVRLYYGLNANANTHTTTKVKIYFLNGNDPTSMNVRLETLISTCKALNKADYTENSWLKLETALLTAETIYNYSSADADMIKTALTDLENAKAGLVKGVDADTKKVLKDLLTISESYKEENYTPKSWAAFAAAVKQMNDTLNDPDASVLQANSAIKAYQEAQAGLATTSLSVPATVPKTDFDAVYGEEKTLTYKGTTRDGYDYKWVFNGKDIVEPKEFNPEIKYESANEEAIRYEVGSSSDFQIISFAQTGKFPGAAEITLDISGKYQNGTYRLYKWNATEKKGEFIENIAVKDGIVKLNLSEGGDYYISSVLQNFNMISNIFEINNTKLTISCAFKSRNTVAGFKNSLENGTAVTVRTTAGEIADDTSFVGTGMTATAANSDVSYTIVVPGDITGDGMVSALDAVEILRAVIGETTLESYAVKAAADVNGDGWVRADDAVAILKYSIGMD